VNTPGETLVEAMDINNSSQILTRGLNGHYILTPIPKPALVGAIVGICVLARRRRIGEFGRCV
jgi:hypothetical protein